MKSRHKQRGWIPALIGAGAAILGGIMTNQANAEQAQLNRDFQADQSGTAHQRQVADLRAAGLNPILSATGGMGARSGAGAQAVMHDPITPAVSSGLDAYRSNAKVKLEQQLERTERENERLRKNQADKEQPLAALGRFAGPAIDSGASVITSAVGAVVSAAISAILPGIPLPDQGVVTRHPLPAKPLLPSVVSKTSRLRELASSSAKAFARSMPRPSSDRPYIPPRGGYSSTDPR